MIPIKVGISKFAQDLRESEYSIGFLPDLLILNIPKKLSKSDIFDHFNHQNLTYTKRKVMKIGIYMRWNAFSMCSKNHKVVTMFRYPKRLKTNKIWHVPKKR